MWSVVVVGVDERVDLVLEFGDGGGGWPASEVFLQGLLEAFDFAAGGGVVRSGVLLAGAEFVEECFESVASASAAGEACGEHHSVVGQR